MPSAQLVDAQAVTRALAHAITAASHAPSIHNTQPWRWRAHGDHLELFLDESRTLAVTDPDLRLAILSCGAALHHALVSLAADGRHATVTRLPDKAETTHLATVCVDARIPVEASAVRHLETIALRHTDRRPVQSAAIDAQKLGSIAAAAESQNTSLHVLRPRQLFDLVAATDHAQTIESEDEAWQAEMNHWTGDDHTLGTGIPDTVIARETSQTTPGREFGHPGRMAIADTHHRTAVFAILYGPGDDDLDWLRAGEALSAAWLKATELGLSVVPLSVTIEVTVTREAVRQLLSGPGHPYLVLRFGVPDGDGACPPRTPRLPAERTVEQP
ncbi:Acg family FMN-binding oxidoreductase [Actinoplanes xinjiangensis]|uniref:Nitroreductase family protein n=1 Tax=Actinoplanes xinjiangensis TaxID=512350 RepID=A0A316F6J0_9ACTN|nr:nitroreductase family protein [Actinoplanes xinjiangensis]PWK32458.1 nitroreductase family protein [Actinoplanes xinjiangensis]GIF45075.1 NAD(P)H nitroreductase [Actinoplanes xinjiangensis]